MSSLRCVENPDSVDSKASRGIAGVGLPDSDASKILEAPVKLAAESCRRMPIPSALRFYLEMKKGLKLLKRLFFSYRFPVSKTDRDRLLVRYPFLKKYHIESFRNLYDKVDLKGKHVLEIGGSNLPGELLFDYFGAARWVCVDHIDFWEPYKTDMRQSASGLSLSESEAVDCRDKHLIFNGSAGELPKNFHGKFDVVVSIACFEHVSELKETLDNIYLALKPGGYLYSSFSPIWSCNKGHHYWYSDEKNFNTLSKKTVQFPHLLMTEEELRKKLSACMSKEELDCLCDWCYHSKGVNRLFYEDYVKLMKESRFTSYECEPFLGSLLDRRTRLELEKKYPGYKMFEASGFVITARR